MEKDVLYALHVAEKLQEDGNIQQQNAQPQQQQAAPQQQVQQQAPIDEKTLEQAFEAALKNTKDEILTSYRKRRIRWKSMKNKGISTGFNYLFRLFMNRN